MKITRRQAREITLSLLFDFGFNSEEKPEELLELYLQYFPYSDEQTVSEGIKEDKYISAVYYGVTEKAAEIDEIIKKYSKHWKFERISRISLSILRMAVYELLYIDDIPPKVTINEAVELAKRFDDDNGYTFINGILGAVVQKLTNGKAEQASI